MKVVLARPQMITTRLTFVSRQTPLNLCYLAAVAREAGAEVQIWDFDAERFREREYCRRLLSFRPDVLGISLMTPTAPRGARLAQLAKQALPGLLTVAGGPHVSALPERTLREFPGFDIAVFGEGELTFTELLERIRVSGSGFREKTRNSQLETCNLKLLAGICGIAYRTETGVIRNKPRPTIEDLDSLPLPARDLLSLRRYHGQSYRGFSRDFLNLAEVSTSRGCPNRCIFCAIAATHGAGARFRSAQNVIAELEHLVKRYGTNHVVFLDDTFTLRPGRLREIMLALKELGLTWNCTTRVDAVDEGLLHAMVAHGCRGVAFGVESGSPRILELIGKRITLGQVRKAFQAAHRAGVANIEADFILGVHPCETADDIEATQQLIKEIRPTTLFLAAVVPYPGTQLWDMMQEEGLIEPHADWEDFLMFGGAPAGGFSKSGCATSWRTHHFTMRELRRKQREMLKSFYIRPGYILRTLWNARSAPELFYYLKSGLSLLRSCKG
jgi:radical SAM superfamily enzyme YgiQ (UPF0313 family)